MTQHWTNCQHNKDVLFYSTTATLFTWSTIIVVENHTSPTGFIPTERGAYMMAMTFLGCAAFILTKPVKLKLSVRQVGTGIGTWFIDYLTDRVQFGLLHSTVVEIQQNKRKGSQWISPSFILPNSSSTQGAMVVQWLLVSPQSKKVVGSMFLPVLACSWLPPTMSP